MALWEKQGKDLDLWNADGITKAVEEVNRGALLMDQKRPGWVDEILPDRLSMSSAEWCIIGQTYGDYDQHVGMPFGADVLDKAFQLYEDEAIKHGFYATEEVPFALLDRVWQYMLYEHKNSNVPVKLELP